jgi:isoamylase
MRLIRSLACAAATALVALPGMAAINASALGAAYNAGHTAITFKVYSSRATRIELWLYAAGSGQAEKLKVTLTKGTGNIWSASVTTSALTSAGISGTVYYGYRAWGPNWTYDASWTKGSGLGFVGDVDAQGNRFNPNKLLMDPYSREISQDPTNPSNLDGTVYASGANYRLMDSGTVAPKGIVFVPDTQSIGTKPTRAFKDDVIY